MTQSQLDGGAGVFRRKYPDEARRMAEATRLAMLADSAGNLGKWMAFRLSDGRTDDVKYDTPIDAALRQLHYKQCAYVRLTPGGMTDREAHVMLNYHRRVYDAGNVPPVLEGITLVMPGLEGNWSRS